MNVSSWLLVIGLCSPAFAQEKSSTKDSRWAVLVGINQYLAEDVPDLVGAEKDVEKVKQLLRDDHGYMTINDNNGSTLQRPIRLWPGVAIVLVQWLARFGIPLVAPDSTAIGLMSGIFGGLAIVIWWALLSRAPWSERLGAIGLMAVALAATVRLVDESIVTGMMGFMFWVYAIPTLSLAFVIGVAVSRHLPRGPRLAAMAAAILIGSGGWALFQTGGFGSDVNHDFAWRWAQTPEDRLVAQANENPPVLSSVAATESEPEWPGFRGPERDGITRGARIETDWSSSPPVELWRREIGPGWSSFSVHGNVFYTQEQRGDDEMVMCYNITTGEPIWQHGDATRFWESNGGAGPRGTPTLANGRVYTFGGTGILNVLDARDGSVVWMRNAETDTKAKLPIWGYSSSPLLVDDLVIVAVSSALIAYDRSDGSPRWTISADGDGGQFINIFPEQNMVVVMTQGNYSEWPLWVNQADNIMGIYILPAVAD